MAERYRIKLNDEEIDLSRMNGGDKQRLAKTTKDADILRKLAENENSLIRYYVAENPNTPIRVLKKLAKDEVPLIGRYAMENPTFKKYVKSLKLSELDEIDYTPYGNRLKLARTNEDVDILKKLAEDESCYVRREVAKNPNTSEDILRKLAEDEDWGIRKGIAKNPNCPEDVLEKLSKDKDKDVGDYARRKLNYRFNKNNLKPISLQDIKIGECRTYNEAEVQQAYYFIFHTMIPIFVKGKKFVLSNSWFTGDREDVYDDIDEYGEENIPWKELTDEAESSDSWKLISASDRDWVCYNESLEDCLEALFENYSISETNFNKIKNEIIRKNKLDPDIKGETDGVFLECALEDSKFKNN